MNFSVPMDQLPAWDSKPWALHGGNFVCKAQKALMRIATPLGVPIALLHPGHREREVGHGHQGEAAAHGGVGGDDDALHPGGAHEEGDTGARLEGRVRVPTLQKAAGRAAILHTFGLRGGYLGRRSRRVSLEDLEDEGKLQDIARSMWNGEIEDYIRCFFPDPQPQPMDPETLPQRFMLVDLLHSEDPMHVGRVPVLCDIYSWTGEASRKRQTIAALLPERISWHGIVRELALSQVCLSRFGNQCIIRIGWDLRLHDDFSPADPNVLITINYDQQT